MKLPIIVMATMVAATPAVAAAALPITPENKKKLVSYLREKGMACRTVARISEGRLEKGARVFRVRCTGKGRPVYRLLIQSDGTVSAQR